MKIKCPQVSFQSLVSDNYCVIIILKIVFYVYRGSGSSYNESVVLTYHGSH